MQCDAYALLYPAEIRGMIGDIDGTVSVLFGRENWGLSNAEIRRSDVICTIPASTAYPILNLSHAVGILCYELAQLPRGTYPSHHGMRWSTSTPYRSVPGPDRTSAIQTGEHPADDAANLRPGPADRPGGKHAPWSYAAV